MSKCEHFLRENESAAIGYAVRHVVRPATLERIWRALEGAGTRPGTAIRRS